jgi:hypothetical protein
VPVIAIFTKVDALTTTAFGELRERGYTREEANERALANAMVKLKMDYIDQLYEAKYKPKRHVYLQGESWCISESRFSLLL